MDQQLNPSSSSTTGASGLDKQKRAVKNTVSVVVEKAQDLLKSNETHTEGAVTKTIENQTSKIPSVIYLGLAGAAMAGSLVLAASPRRKELANFVGLWVPSILILGLYNKIVKTQGSDMGHQFK